MGGQFEGADLLLLTTTGAKSGQPRFAPLAYFTIDGKMIIIGSKAGADTNPDWVHNLRANPGAHIEVGTDAYDVTSRELPPMSATRSSTRSSGWWRSPGRLPHTWSGGRSERRGLAWRARGVVRQPGAAGAERVADGDGAAVDVDLGESAPVSWPRRATRRRPR